MPSATPGTNSVFAPDGKSLAFFAGGKLQRVDLTGGAPWVICDVIQARGGTWGSGFLLRPDVGKKLHTELHGPLHAVAE
jgi:hypothetical protein